MGFNLGPCIVGMPTRTRLGIGQNAGSNAFLASRSAGKASSKMGFMHAIYGTPFSPTSSYIV